MTALLNGCQHYVSVCASCFPGLRVVSSMYFSNLPRSLNLARSDGPAYSVPSKFIAIFIFGSMEYCSYISKVYFQLASNSRVRMFCQLIIPCGYTCMKQYRRTQYVSFVLSQYRSLAATVVTGYHSNITVHRWPIYKPTKLSKRHSDRYLFGNIYFTQRCSEIGKCLGIKKVYVSNRAISNWSNEIVNFTTLFGFFCLYKTHNQTHVVICDKF